MVVICSGVIYLLVKHLIPCLTVYLIRIILLFENATEKQNGTLTTKTLEKSLN